MSTLLNTPIQSLGSSRVTHCPHLKQWIDLIGDNAHSARYHDVVHHYPMSIEVADSPNYTYKYRFGFGQLMNLAIAFGLLGFALFLGLRFELDNVLATIICFLSIVGLTTFLLTLHYLVRSFGLTIKIDQTDGTFEVTNNGRTNSYKLKDITSVEICEQQSIGLYGFDFDFIRYTFSNGNVCVATNHMTNQYFIPTGIEPNIQKAIFPVIWKPTNA